MPYDPRAIANRFLDLASRDGKPISPMKMQKLVYFAHGWCLAIKNRPLLNEQVEAWPYGPVVRSLYRQLREYGNRDIVAKLVDSRVEFHGGVITAKTPSLSDQPKEETFTSNLLDRVWSVYAQYSAIQLSNMTHEPGTPWHEVYSRYLAEDLPIPKGTDIPSESIKKYFSELGSKPNQG